MSRNQFELPDLLQDEVLEVGQTGLICSADGWGEQSVEGQLIDFDPAARVVKIRPAGQLRSLSLKFNQIKRLKIDAHPDRAAAQGHTDAHSLELSPSTHSFLVSLRDGALYSGICQGFRKTEQGLWIFPKPVLEGDPQRVFVPKNGILRFELRSGDVSQIADTDFAQTLLHEWVHTQPLAPAPADPVSVVENLADLQRALQRQANLKPVPIGEALVGLGKLTQEQLTQVLGWQQADQSRQPLGQLLLDKGLVSAADLQTAFARKMGYPFVSLNKFPIDAQALRRVPFALAQRLQVLPLVEQGSALVVAMADPLQFRVIDDLEFTTQRKILPVVSVSAEIGERIQQAYREVGLSDLAHAAATPPARGQSPRPGPVQQPQDAVQLAVELAGDAKDELDEKPIEQSDNTLVRLINSMIAEAYQQGASDIHIEPYPGRQKLLIRFRVDGQMRNYLELPASYRNALVARIKIMCDLDISERRKPQDGKINFSKFGNLPIELRVATVPTAGGLEDVVLRLLSSSEPVSLEQLQLNARNLERFEALVERPYGLFLCVGPTGSGKTTTLHSALRRINTPNRKIWTAEDPVEITQRGLRQIQVNPKIGWTFAAALRTLLRADPDVIMVGEIRDHETAEIAIEASLTGHLVFSTLHTNSAAETVVRLIDLGVDPFSFADSLQGVLAQRLVRRVCKHCAVEQPLEAAQVDELLRDYQALLPAAHPLRQGQSLLDEWMQRYAKDGRLWISHAAGCEQCAHTGYAGRLALHELLCSSPEMRRLVQTRARSAEMQHLAIDEGMRTLRQDGLEKLLQGLTSLAEVRSNTMG
ncbi:type II secretory pathway, ATPase PulE/Tfp pilus assembly pathway, ATPase PilB [Serpentinimonas raichei]|uniref:Type II secretory pathway, ATPase PulE/Tfp pilus assembly pathway, ATPase PilB n=1 Tax=Serpentinimonas raichei TaxID=1458425 RepID=A0A060NLW1_9BURK|nr:ATPase, T2SS/T4P/T4SS family [Serpentinimonas raichei]BAO80518.1 type II secretory pathway, ATPase PulE/Tfp pilus assembly pathway, ATPase PilB [Serpentinimonas raichei]